MKTELKETLVFFGVVAFVYFLCSAGHIDTIDADASVELAKSLVFDSSFSVHPKRWDPMIYAINKNGNSYSKMGLATALIYTPVIALENFINGFLASSSLHLLPFLISFVNPILTAFMLALIFLHFRIQSKTSLEATFLCLLIGFGTYLFTYSKTCQREILQAVCLLGSFLFPQLLKKTFANLGYSLGGLFFGFGILTKLPFIFFLIPALVALQYSRPSKKQLALFLLPIGLFTVLYLWYSYLCFGTLLGTGYSKDVTQIQGRAWSTPFLNGIWQQTFDWKTGLLAYNPILILIVPIWIYKFIQKQWTWLDSAVLISFIIQLSIHARWWSPTGDNALGPRYLVVLIPLLAMVLNLPFHLIIKRMNKLVQISIFLFCILNIAFQFIQVGIKPQLYWTLGSQSIQKLESPLWLANLKILKHKLSNNSEEYDLREFGGDNKRITLSKHRSYVGFNFWWSHLSRHLRQKNLAEREKPIDFSS